jgi:hypothetical protein
MGQLLFKKCFWDAIRAGTKRTTLRRWASPRVKPGARAFAPGVGWLQIGAVDAVELAALGDADARADGFGSLAEMIDALAAIYPDHARDGKRWFRVAFEWEAGSLPPQAPATSEARERERFP